jgi:hypothetical protein
MLMAEARGAIADPAIAKAQALMSVAAGVRREAYVSAYSETFWIVGVGLIIGLCASSCDESRGRPKVRSRRISSNQRGTGVIPGCWHKSCSEGFTFRADVWATQRRR